eukprot:scaffold252580_cov27-Tisochrysis_lutea.AAC.1
MRGALPSCRWMPEIALATSTALSRSRSNSCASQSLLGAKSMQQISSPSADRACWHHTRH